MTHIFYGKQTKVIEGFYIDGVFVELDTIDDLNGDDGWRGARVSPDKAKALISAGLASANHPFFDDRPVRLFPGPNLEKFYSTINWDGWDSWAS